ncbi:MAG TPA: hypothetical protein VJO15_07130, partial [Dehalococcoidia bacterium]|nr:hypothetical protein [Dehalococcoidia bacterium]
KYVVRTAGRTLPISSPKQNLAPGAYTVYYLPRSGWLLSAERSGGNPEGETRGDWAETPWARWDGSSAPPPDPAYFDPADQLRAQQQGLPFAPPPAGPGPIVLDALAQAHGFSQAALYANRAGRVGEGQGFLLLRSAASSFLFGAGSIAVAVFVWSTVASAGDADPGALAGGGVFALAFVGAGLFMLYTSRRAIGDALEGRAVSVEGQGSRTTSVSSESSTTYYCSVGTVQFTVPRATYEALVEGIVYRAYYAPRSQTLLSTEPVAGMGA